jgi:hypothetical protein
MTRSDGVEGAGRDACGQIDADAAHGTEKVQVGCLRGTVEREFPPMALGTEYNLGHDTTLGT